MQLHFALVPDEQSCARLRELSARAAKEINHSDFILTTRETSTKRRRAVVALPHVTVLVIEVKEKWRGIVEAIQNYAQRGHAGTPGIHPGLLHAISIHPRETEWVEDIGYLQLNTPHDAIRSIHEILVRRVTASKKRREDIVIRSSTGDVFRPHITLTHATDAPRVAQLATLFQMENAWSKELRFTSLEVCGVQKFGTFQGGTVLVKC